MQLDYTKNFNLKKLEKDDALIMTKKLEGENR